MSSETLMPFVRRARYQPSQSTIVFGITVVLALFLSAALHGFLTFGNLFALARNISILGILALGMAVVVIGRGLDLSQVATFAASTAIAIILMNSGYATPIALLVGFLMAVAIGVINGFLISVVEMPPLLTTLASSLAVLGLTRTTAVQHYVVYLSKGHDDFLRIGGNIWGGVPVPILIFLATAIVVHLFLSRTVLGRFVYAHGD